MTIDPHMRPHLIEGAAVRLCLARLAQIRGEHASAGPSENHGPNLAIPQTEFHDVPGVHLES
jgi:hypothetical protein